jgi:hypothetical protein
MLGIRLGSAGDRYHDARVGQTSRRSNIHPWMLAHKLGDIGIMSKIDPEVLAYTRRAVEQRLPSAGPNPAKRGTLRLSTIG